MLTEVSPGNGNTSITLPLAPARPAWWARLLARIPLRALYGFAGLLGWLAFRAFPYRQHVVRENLIRAFPDFDEARLRAVMRGYYLGFAQMLVEVIKSVTLPAHAHRESRGAPRAPRAGPVGAAGGSPPVQLGMDAARAVPGARLSARCRL